jgi:phenylpropionate dioxygenase-like ring-hydroxylating dioxygenase large terminal subunit
MNEGQVLESISVDDLEHAVTYGTEPFLSVDYLRDEKRKLWPKTWQMAERVEDIPSVGDFFTYNVADESVIVIRTAPDEIKAFHNVCPHRGRQLVDVPPGVHSVRGNKRRFVCGFHGWMYDAEGRNMHILDQDDWRGALNPDCTSLTPVQVGLWGGWIFVNLDLQAEPLAAFLGNAAERLNPFEFEKMRYKWRQWVVFDCNWKTGIEAFMEPYHVTATHSQLLKYGQYYSYSKALGLHSVSGFDERDPEKRIKESTTLARAGKGSDARKSTYELQREQFETVNGSSTTETLVAAASRLVDELPEGTSPGDVVKHWLASARADDAVRGVVWPEITPDEMSAAGLAWHVFPNLSITQGVTFALCYRTRPYGDDPDKCIFEAFALERFPEGAEPRPEWTYADPVPEKWGSVLCQDFSNMAAVQRGMKSSGFRGTLPNPHQERKVTNFHRNLADLLGRPGPRRFNG